jgi:adenylate cyclase
MLGIAQQLSETSPEIVGVVTNLPELSAAAAGEGSFGVVPDVDGIIRRVPLLFHYKDSKTGKTTVYPSLAVEALRVYHSAKGMVNIRALKEDESGIFDPPLVMKVGNLEVPFDWDAEINAYFTPARTSQYISAGRVIAGEVNPERISGRIVFVGTSAEGLKDIRSTPLNLYIPGVELHINVVEQILTGEYLQRPEIIKGAELMAMIGVGCLIIVLVPFIGAIYMALFTLALVGATAFLSWYSFEELGLLIDPVYPSICLLSIFMAATLLTYIRTEYERSRVRQAFGLYISPDFMEELTKDPDKLKLGGETRELTVMFTDIRGFTTISESMSPEALTQLMNSFLTPMSDLVMETRGTIDKYMGDAMMAFWNAPLDDAEHARHACTAALRMYEALAPVNEELKVRAQAERRAPVVLNAGIGINTGTASVGNMGSRQRFAYSALGDTVNLASRLEGQTKAYGVNILISEATVSHVPDFASLELDLIRVKGKNEPVRIFTLLGEGDMAAGASFRQWHERHGQMMVAYRATALDDALRLIAECRAISGGMLDGFYAVFAARIEELKNEPPAPGWDGVYVATSK